MDYREGAIQTAERLLNELRPKMANDSDFRLMSNFVHLAKKTKVDAEIALNEFLQFSSEERNREHVGAILGIATAQMILKQVPRARNQLKRVMKAPWNFGDAEYLEKCWILLADIYIQSGKYDISTDLLKRALQYNKSCTKAYEYMGYIMEKEQSYKDAAQYYESAWKQGNQNNPAIGAGEVPQLSQDTEGHPGKGTVQPPHLISPLQSLDKACFHGPPRSNKSLYY